MQNQDSPLHGAPYSGSATACAIELAEQKLIVEDHDPDPQWLLNSAAQLRERLPKPLHSGFRVCCLLRYRASDSSTLVAAATSVPGATATATNGTGSSVASQDAKKNPIRFLFGTNIETGSLCCGVCAEKCALSQLRVVDPSAKILQVAIVTDAPGNMLVTPGPTCREFMIQNFNIAEDNVPIILGGGYCATTGIHHVVKTVNLRELWPFPNLYDRIPRAEVEAKAGKLGKLANILCFADPNHRLLYDAALAYLREKILTNPRKKTHTQGHPVLYLAAAQVELERKTDCQSMPPASPCFFAVQAQAKEYPATVDAVSRVMPLIEHHIEAVSDVYAKHPSSLFADMNGTKKRKVESGLEYMNPVGTAEGSTVAAPTNSEDFEYLPSDAVSIVDLSFIRSVLILQIDQFGICHAPFAHARSYLSEYGYGEACVTYVHDALGQLHGPMSMRELYDAKSCVRGY